MFNAKIFFYSFVLLLMFPSAYGSNSTLYTKALMATFGNGCKSHGNLTSTSLEHSSAIINMIEAIQNDSQCSQWASGVKSAIGGISSFKAPENTFKADLLSSELSNLHSALELEDDIDVSSAIASNIVKKKIELVSIGANIDESLWLNRKSSISNFHQFSSNLTAMLNSNIKCVQKYPGIVMQIGGQIMSIVGNFNMWGNIAGLGIMGAGAAVDLAISSIKSASFFKQLKNLEESKLTEAIICAYEKVAANYCQARRKSS